MSEEPRGRTLVVGATGWIGSDLMRVINGAEPVTTSLVVTGGLSYLASLGIGPGDSLVNAAGSKDPDVLWSVNVGVVETLVTFAEKSGARVVQLGSAAEYGLSSTAKRVTEADPETPDSAYGESKLQATHLVRDSHAEGVVLRLFNIASSPPQPGSPLDDVLARTYAGSAAGKDIEILSAATTRDWVTKGFVLTSVAFAAGSDVRGVYNIASGQGTSMGDLVRALLVGLDSPVGVRDLEAIRPTSIIGDFSQWQRVSGLREHLDVEGIARMLLRGAGERTRERALTQRREVLP